MSVSCATMTASDLFATSQGSKNEGDQECHWCASPCGRDWLHDEPPPLPFTRAPKFSLRPCNLYICRGCWLWRRKRVSVRFLDGTFKDGQAAYNHSWLIWREEARGIKPPCAHLLWQYLLKPPAPFCLALIYGEGQQNHLQFAVANDYDKIQADTPLRFTLNGMIQKYTVYELQEAIKTGKDTGKEPGVQTLVRLYGLPQAPQPEKKAGRKTGQIQEGGQITKQPVKSGA